jgi:hypothetical protein
MEFEISTSYLSIGIQGDDVAQVHQALQARGRGIPVAEGSKGVSNCLEI